MFNKDDQRLSSSSVNYGRVRYHLATSLWPFDLQMAFKLPLNWLEFKNSLLNVPNSYEEESAPPAFGAQSFRNVNTMDGIEEENSDEQNRDEEKRREGTK